MRALLQVHRASTWRLKYQRAVLDALDVPATEPEGPADSWNWFRSYGDENWEFKMKCSSIVASSTGTVTTRHSHCALADTDAALAA
jgi:hypothetical protein